MNCPMAGRQVGSLLIYSGLTGQQAIRMGKAIPGIVQKRL